jgi:hypothetical protein
MSSLFSSFFRLVTESCRKQTAVEQFNKFRIIVHKNYEYTTLLPIFLISHFFTHLHKYNGGLKKMSPSLKNYYGAANTAFYMMVCCSKLHQYLEELCCFAAYRVCKTGYNTDGRHDFNRHIILYRLSPC